MPEIAYGYCQCGCGEPAPICPRTDRARGYIKGEPSSFVLGHNRRKSAIEYRVKDCGYETPCWVWQKAFGPKGYGQAVRDGKVLRAHRVYYEERVGPIPATFQIDHLCRNHSCVNPDHLEPVTGTENQRRGIKAKLTLEKAREIRARYAEGGWTQKELAKRYGVVQGTINYVLNGDTWKEGMV